MKKTIILIVFLSVFQTGFSQSLTTNDLLSILNKSSLEYISQYLTNKGWEYHESERENNIEQNITWSYEKNYYNDAAKGWIHLYFHSGKPVLVNYQFFNEKSYNIFKGGIAGAGFKFCDSEVQDNAYVTNYKNSNYYLEVISAKGSYSASYTVKLLKKGSAYDQNNGIKTEQLDDGGHVEYTLVDGMLNGQVKIYDEEGILVSEYIIKNEKKEGPYKRYYRNGQVQESGQYKGDESDGKCTQYSESGKVTAEIVFQKGEYVSQKYYYYDDFDNLKDKIVIDWQKYNKSIYYRYHYVDGKEYLMDEFPVTGRAMLVNHSPIRFAMDGSRVVSNTFGYLPNTILEPDELEFVEFQLTSDDNMDDIGAMFFSSNSGIKINDVPRGAVCVFDVKDGSLNGHFGCYLDEKVYRAAYVDKTLNVVEKMFPRSIDTTKLNRYLIGGYVNGQKNGVWKKYHPITGKLLYQREYADGTKTGQWLDYFEDGTLKSETNYNGGLLNGVYREYLQNGKIKFEHRFQDNEKEGIWRDYFEFDSIDNEWKEVVYVRSYKDGLINGKLEYTELSTGYKFTGQYQDGKLNGTVTRYAPKKDYESVETYANGKKEGQLIITDLKSGQKQYYTFHNDEKHGSYKKTTSNGSVMAIGNFSHDKQDGVWDFYEENQHWKVTFIRGKRCGVAVHFNADEIKDYTFTYDNNSHLEKVQIFEDDNVIKSYSLSRGNASTYTCQVVNIRPDTTFIINYYIPSYETIDFETLGEFLDWFDSETMIGGKHRTNGIYSASKTTDVTKVYFMGSLNDDVKEGKWTFYYPEQDVVMNVLYNHGAIVNISYQQINGEAFSGKFEYIDEELDIIETRKIKAGIQKGDGKQKHLSTGKNVSGSPASIEYVRTIHY